MNLFELMILLGSSSFVIGVPALFIAALLAIVCEGCGKAAGQALDRHQARKDSRKAP